VNSLKQIKNIWSYIPTFFGVVVLLVPDYRSWLGKHVLFGWVVAIFLTFLYPLCFSLFDDGRKTELELAKDIKLAEDRLGNWTLDGRLFRFLTFSPNHSHFPQDIADEIMDKFYAWNADTRKIKNRKLRMAFDNFRKALNEYEISLSENTYIKELAVGSALTDRSDFRHVPPEWEIAQPGRYQEAYRDLAVKNIAFFESLRSLLNLIYDLQLKIPGSPSTIEQ
jgi:hypothetical protein